MTNGGPGIVNSAKSRTDRVTNAVKRAMLIMEQEIAESDGIYPHNAGRVSMAEVCRRADVHPITMMGVAHRDTTRVTVLSWIESLSAKLVTGARTIQKIVKQRVDTADESYRLIAAKFQAMYQVEIPKRDEAIEALQARVSELESDNLQLQEKLSQGRVARRRGNKP